eukprot:773021_1
MPLIHYSPTVLLITKVNVSLWIGHNFFSTIYHLIRLKTYRPDVSFKRIPPIHWIALLYLIFTILYGIISMISMFDLFPSCAIQSKIRLNAFSVTYIYQWIVLSERVFAILRASAYQFHQHSIWSIRILIVSTIIFWCIINGIYLDGYYD